MPNFSQCRRTFVPAVILFGLVGCAPEAQRLANSISHPGPAYYQRQEAVRHDPYLLDDVGPEVVGARPREYQRPLNEVERARLSVAPPPGVAALPPRVPPIAPAPVLGPPVVAPPPTATTITTPYPPVPAQAAPPAYPVAPTFQPAPPSYLQRPPY